ncbi:sigma-70 family RNA polymerase sigma factor [Microbacterium aurugineum]|uniref:Sigma-70 family RNA polymerase sigma factor n=1 Tax=Microbacterium aurugineum TaxID=2851642 RepID=A0ABY4J0F1_9MICO|nr:sigma-70 family RNA polymerase sigma factor [Microbacterium aurugineum]UPL18419.1 sigma-70 family RNA polymerase sigma factor [Microbacterium aurugineum]
MIVHEENSSHDELIGDADLILRARSGDTGAFGELWRRHYPSGITVARSITSSIDPDDLVQEAYTRIYQAIIKGGGPNGSFRAYLFTSIRNTAAGWGRARRETAIDELDTVADPETTDQAANEALDRSLTAQAFRSLPTRWQEVLWYTEIEQMKPQEVGHLLGMKSGAVSQLAFRAREGLREAWIQAHLRSAEDGSECQWTIEHLGAYSRGNLSTRDHKRLELHLDDCARCMIVAAEAKDVSQRLALVLLPLVLGVAGASGYLATLQGAGAPIVALAAMPSSIPGAVFGGDGGAGAVAAGTAASGAGTGSGGGAGSGGAAGGGAGGAGASGGVFTGIGALVGAGSAALVVAGVVAAATILPGLAGANPETSLPSAGDTDPSSITSDVGPDESMTLDEPVVIDEPVTPPPAPVPPVEETRTPAADAAPPVETPPVAPVTPVAPVAPVAPPEPVDPVPPVDPPDPEVAEYPVIIFGAPGATVEGLLDDSPDGGDTIVLDEFGQGTLVFSPSVAQNAAPEATKVTVTHTPPVGQQALIHLPLRDFTPEGGVIGIRFLGDWEIPPTEEPDTEDPATEEPNPEDPPAEEPPTEETPLDESTNDTTPTDDTTPADETPVDHAPADEEPTEATPQETDPAAVEPAASTAPESAAPGTGAADDSTAPTEDAPADE